MCQLGFHNCPECGEEYKCDQPNSECPTLNGYNNPCEKCEYWAEESLRERDRDERRKWEQEQWEREYGIYER